ncbi:MAG: thermonuclease family protein [Proteobacteria bacterium]|nr:thermonuclease family protein [Pseudomonadota bacterium]
MNIASLSALLLIILIFTLPSVAVAKLYRWVDDKGVSHFSNRPPAAVVAEASQVRRVKKTATKKKLFDFREKVVRVIGLDIVELASGKQVKYIGVAPTEAYLARTGRKDAAGEALAFHRKLVEGKTVTVLLGREKKNSQGCYLGHVFLGQQAFINAELIRQGYALTEEYPSDFEYQSLFIRLMKDAQKSRRGIWAF